MSPPPRVSMIVPVWGDAAMVPGLIADARQGDRPVEWIVAAVQGETDTSALGGSPHLLVRQCPAPSRGDQMNLGARGARGDVLCFHHADSGLRPPHLDALVRAADDRSLAGGAFERAFDGRHPIMRPCQNLVNRANRHIGPFFGDQSIFVRREVFHSLGGFAPIPIMEDVEFSRRLRRAGPVTLLRPPVRTSSRRFRRMGNLRCTMMNAWLIACFHLGVPPAVLHRWYYNDRPPRNNPAP